MGPPTLYSIRRFLLVAAVGVAVTSTRVAGAGCSTTPICLDLKNCTNVAAFGLQVEVGRDGQAGQNLCLGVSSVMSATYLLGPEACENDPSNEQCEASHGGTIDINAIPGFSSQSTPTAGIESPVETFWNDLNGAVTTFGAVDFELSGSTELDDFEVGIVTNGTKFNIGQLGVGPKSTWLQSLKNKGLIDRLMFGFDGGSQSPVSSRPGHLVLGGYDRLRVDGPFVEFDINYEPTEKYRPCPFRVQINSIGVVFDDGRSAPFIGSESGKLEACIEPYDNLFRFPETRLSALDIPSIGLNKGRLDPNNLPDAGLLVNEIGWRYLTSNRPPPFSFNIALQGAEEEFQALVPSEQLQHPLRGIDKDGNFAVNNNYTELNIFEEAAVKDTIVFGKAFLSQVSLTVC
ncbi:hypothetical protein ABW19_dt0210499 [Dactylella cylindrospora]|nr:hypothetical protein ABW19_dt0210499 [Dactylella cylindrospora]